MRYQHVSLAAHPRFSAVTTFVLMLALPILAYGFSGGPPNGVTGAPGEGTCVDCHSDFPLNSGTGSLTIEGPPAFEPNATYTITITMAQNGQSRWGFEFSPLDVGSCTLTDPANTQLDVEGGKTYVKQTSEGTYDGTSGPAIWSFNWTAPADAPTQITFYAAGNAADGNGSTSGDYVYATTLTMDLVPVELTHFGADAQPGSVLLQWSTLSEHDNAGFNIYRAETEQYRLITETLIRGAGTSVVPRHYSFTDETVETGRTYSYRLSDISLSGVETFHRPIAVTLPTECASGLNLRISPNPIRHRADIIFTLAKPMSARVTIHDLTGRELFSHATSPLSPGDNTVGLDEKSGDPRSLPLGMYLCTVTAGGQTATAPVLVIP